MRHGTRKLLGQVCRRCHMLCYVLGHHDAAARGSQKHGTHQTAMPPSRLHGAVILSSCGAGGADRLVNLMSRSASPL